MDRFQTVIQDLHGNCYTGSRKAAVQERKVGNGIPELNQAQEKLDRKGKQKMSELITVTWHKAVTTVIVK